MYEKVLVPLDGSSFAERVLPHLEFLLSPQQTELILLRVMEPYHFIAAPDFPPAATPLDREEQEEAIQAYLDEVKGELQEAGFTVHTRIAIGDVASGICDEAEDQNVDLIAMTTHGRGGLSRWAFGSVADRVVRSAYQPIFLVRGTTEACQPGEIGRILVPLDGSDLAEQALPAARSIAHEKGAELVLLRVVEPLSDREAAAMYATWSSVDDVYAHRLTEAEQYLGDVQAELQKEGLSATALVEEGHPATVILDVEELEDVNLVVMSTHGRSGLARWVYGSVADKVLREAVCPLLLIRARPES